MCQAVTGFRNLFLPLLLSLVKESFDKPEIRPRIFSSSRSVQCKSVLHLLQRRNHQLHRPDLPALQHLRPAAALDLCLLIRDGALQIRGRIRAAFKRACKPLQFADKELLHRKLFRAAAEIRVQAVDQKTDQTELLVKRRVLDLLRIVRIIAIQNIRYPVHIPVLVIKLVIVREIARNLRVLQILDDQVFGNGEACFLVNMKNP